jgi:SOS-response transcriptional repressor LexA
MKMDGDDMADKGVPHGSILVVDRSITPAAGMLAVIAYEGGLLCREMTENADGRLAFTNGKTCITPAEGEAEVFGTVKAIVRLL